MPSKPAMAAGCEISDSIYIDENLTVKEVATIIDTHFAPYLDAVRKAEKLLETIDNMTTEEFKIGADRLEREALRMALKRIDAA